MLSRALAAVLVLAACGVRAPQPIDVPALLATRGPIEARRDLEIRILASPRDLQARLALARLDEELHRPAEAIDELDEVEQQGGPLGVRWHADDRARLARLVAARGQARLARGSSAALADLERAQKLGAMIAGGELDAARAAAAVVALRHVDAGVRAGGRATLAALSRAPGADPSWRGAGDDAAPADRAAFGAWLWAHGARREAYEQLAAWHDAIAPAQREPAAQAAYLRAVAWWRPSWLGEVKPPDAAERVGPERCRFGCAARDALGDADAERALLAAPLGPRTTDPDEAAALAAIALRGALRGEGAWGQLIAARVDVAKLDLRAVPRGVRPLFARLVGKREAAATPAELQSAGDDVRLVAGAERVLAGASQAAVRAALGPAADRADGQALLALAATAPATPTADDARALAVARYAAARVAADAGGRVDADLAVVAIARAYAKDPAVGERRARDYVAAAIDAAIAHATVGAAFAAMGDAAHAREEWQAAAAMDPAFEPGLAEAIARAGDSDAALVEMAPAAAASGDPAPVLTLVGRALLEAGKPVDALNAARGAIDLAGPDALAEALDLGIDASRAVKRDDQADGLAAKRSRLAPPRVTVLGLDDPTDAAVALYALQHAPTASATARAWVATRWNPRDVALRVALLGAIDADDARRGALVAELATLAGDRDPERALTAARALTVKPRR